MDRSTELAESLLATGSEAALIRALEERLAVGEAIGIFIGRHHVDADRAMQMLANDAARCGVTVGEAAVSMVEEYSYSFRALDPHGWAMSRR